MSRLGQTVKIRGAGDGEGPWWASDSEGGGTATIDGMTGEHLVLWANGILDGGMGPTITGPVTIVFIHPNMWVLEFFSDGSVTIEQDPVYFGGILVHKFTSAYNPSPA